MAEFQIISEKPITLAETSEKLAKIEKITKELSFRATKTKEYLASFATKEKKVAELKKKLEELNIARMRDRHIVKLIDIMPKDIDSLRIILSGESITLKEEDLRKILSVLND